MFIARNLYKFLEIYHAARNLPIQLGKFILTDHHQPWRAACLWEVRGAQMLEVARQGRSETEAAMMLG